MTIRQRMTLLIILTFLAISSIGGYAVFQSRGSAAAVKQVTEGVVPSALASADLVSQLKEVQLATLALVFEPDPKLVAQSRDKLTARKALLKDALDLQARQAAGDAQRGLVEQAKESLANYFAAIDETTKFKLAAQADMAQAYLFASVAMYQAELEVIVETLRIEKNRSKDAAISGLNASLATTTAALTAVTIVAVILLSLIGTLLYRQITRPISRMQLMMSEIAASQDFTRRVPVDRMDEIGRSIVAFNAMIAKIQESSAQLRQKTADIQTMLQNMPQGILTITEGSRIHPEYSAYLETILETRDIVGRDLMDLLFSDSHLGGDSFSQIAAAVSACIGEDVMNFEFNEHLMVGEIEKTMADGRVKILDLNWSPISDEAGTTVRLMLCLRDVTELRKLAAEANEQKRELAIIGEILAVSQEKFHEFLAGSMKLIDENEQTIRLLPQSNAFAVAQLFRNMHTLKGNARTYGLLHLSNIVHAAEHSYAELRKPEPTLAWDQGRLLEELAEVKAAVERYARINEVSLGRKGPGRRGNAERYLMVDKEHIQESLHRLETVNTGNLHELVTVRDAVRRTLRLLGTEKVAETLSPVIESLPSLAKQLGKAAPVVRIEDGGYVVHNQASSVLKNVFTHLLRNALDHGLEKPAQRLALGKAEAGTIRLQVGRDAGMLQIALSDDGWGLALERIRGIAIEKGLIAAEDPLGDEEIARLIFRSGFSTAASVTEISGRGVGMDAVQDLVKREGGRVVIEFSDSAVGAEFRQFRVVVFLPASYAVDVDGDDADLAYRADKPVLAPLEAGDGATERHVA